MNGVRLSRLAVSHVVDLNTRDYYNIIPTDHQKAF